MHLQLPAFSWFSYLVYIGNIIQSYLTIFRLQIILTCLSSLLYLTWLSAYNIFILYLHYIFFNTYHSFIPIYCHMPSQDPQMHRIFSSSCKDTLPIICIEKTWSTHPFLFQKPFYISHYTSISHSLPKYLLSHIQQIYEF